MEIIDLPLISYIAKTKKPILMSTGMASEKEVGEAIETAKSSGCKKLGIFHCISSYPTPIEEATYVILKLKKFGVHVGLSDHTLGNTASIVAISLGATIIEKHFTLSRVDGGVDSAFSSEPKEMQRFVVDIKSAYLALGTKKKLGQTSEIPNKAFRRSIYFIKDIKKEELITKKYILKGLIQA